MDLKERLKQKLADRKGSGTETFAIQVTGYGNEAVKGKRPDGVEVTVKLRADTATPRRRSIADYANPRHRDHVDVGGFLRVDSAYKGPDGAYQARWLARIATTPEEGRPLQGFVRVSPARPKASGEGFYRTADILTGEIHEPANAKALKEAIGASIRSAGLAFVRVGIDDATRAWTINGGKDGQYQTSPSYQQVMELVSDVKETESWPDEMVVEVLPAQRLFFGPEGAVQSRLDTAFVAKSETSGELYSRGFTEAVVSIVRKADGYEFVGDVAPTRYEPEFMKLGPPTDRLSAQQLAPAEQQLAAKGPAAAADPEDDLPEFDLSSVPPARVSEPPGSRRVASLR